MLSLEVQRLDFCQSFSCFLSGVRIRSNQELLSSRIESDRASQFSEHRTPSQLGDLTDESEGEEERVVQEEEEERMGGERRGGHQLKHSGESSKFATIII